MLHISPPEPEPVAATPKPVTPAPARRPSPPRRESQAEPSAASPTEEPMLELDEAGLLDPSSVQGPPLFQQSPIQGVPPLFQQSPIQGVPPTDASQIIQGFVPPLEPPADAEDPDSPPATPDEGEA